MGLSPQTLLEYGWRKQRFSVSVRINIKDNLAGITYEVKPFVTDSGSAVNIRNISFAAAIGNFRNISVISPVGYMRHSAVCYIASNNCRIYPARRQRLCFKSAAADFNLADAWILINFYRLGASLSAVIARMSQSVIKTYHLPFMNSMLPCVVPVTLRRSFSLRPSNPTSPVETIVPPYSKFLSGSLLTA